MHRPVKFSPEVCERAVRMVQEHLEGKVKKLRQANEILCLASASQPAQQPVR